MNNILSDTVIERVNNYDTTELYTLFKEILDDQDSRKRNAQRLGVNNRFKLEPADKYVLGRDATGVPAYIRPDSKNKIDSELLTNMPIHKPYPNIIASNKSGYLSGYEVESKTKNENIVNEFATFEEENHFTAVFNDLVRKCTGYGKKAIRLYLEDGISKVSELEPWNYVPFYSKTGQIVGVMQWQKITTTVKTDTNKRYRVSYVNESEDLYFMADMTQETMTLDSVNYPATVVDSFEVADGVRPHGYNGVPIVEFLNNSDELGDVEKTLDSQDARDELLSKSSTTWGAFADVLMRDKSTDNENIDIIEWGKLLRDWGLVTGDIDFISRSYEAYHSLTLR
jgi:SPP1 family phage portal protein